MNKNKGLLSLVGFFLTALGFLSIALGMVGVKFAFLQWLDTLGPLLAFIAKLAMIIAGILALYIAQSNFSGDDNTEY
ncbi:MAG: hypothetical protein KDC66_01835 [Phaeodactylibacter sp.]|nr:hypothetical protein [Phaeodactylibacter sp.]MCB9275279.1 hypothetical protein [Lewinellaceae bacterium]